MTLRSNEWIRARCAAIAIDAIKQLGLEPNEHRIEIGALADVLHKTVTGNFDDKVFEACQWALAANDITGGREREKTHPNVSVKQ